MRGNGFLSMFGCVCLYVWKWGDFILARIPKRSACLSLFTPVLSWFVWWWVQRRFIALMGSYLAASVLSSYECPETVLTLTISEPIMLQNLKYSWLIENGINPMAFADAFPWHWGLKSCNFAEIHKGGQKSAFTAPFSWLLESKEEPNLDGFFCH